MIDFELLNHYEAALKYIRYFANEFSEAHPKLASHLNSHETIKDPLINDLIEANALLNARTQYKLNEDSYRFCKYLIDIFYPNYLKPIPAMSIAKFDFQPETIENTITIDKTSQLQIDTMQGETCYFQTCYTVNLLPIKISQVTLGNNHSCSKNYGKTAHLTINLKFFLKNVSTNNDHYWRFYINASLLHAYKIYELIFHQTDQIKIHSSSNNQSINNIKISPVGFKAEDNLLPHDARVFSGYSLMTEFFCLPEKFLFFDIIYPPNLVNEILRNTDNLDIVFQLKKTVNEHEFNHIVKKDIFALGCTPIVNLFHNTARPFELTHTQTEYSLIPDTNNPHETTEIYTIQNVHFIDQNNCIIDCLPHYGSKYNHNEVKHFYRTNCILSNSNEYERHSATETSISFIHDNMDYTNYQPLIVTVDLLCTNRNLTHYISSHKNQLRLTNNELLDIKDIKLLTNLTPIVRRKADKIIHSTLISCLLGNYFSLSDDKNNLANIRQIIQFCAVNHSIDVENLLASLKAITCNPTTSKLSNNKCHNLICHGTQVVLEVDESQLNDSSLFLFGCILNQFFALSTEINTFTQLTIINQHQQELYRWEPNIHH